MNSSDKSFKTIDEQLELLKRRRLTIEDEENARKYLLTNTYYDIINGYSKYFEESTNRYLIGSTFDEICKLNWFDKEIRRTMFNAILVAEQHVKSIFAYRFSERYPYIESSYLNLSAYDPRKEKYARKTIEHLNNNLEYLRKKERAVSHYLEKYGYVPIWVLVEFIDFGTFYHLISNVRKSLQNKVAQDLKSFIDDNIQKNNVNVFTPECMLSFLKNIKETRNICAHNNRLIGFSCRADSYYFQDIYCSYGIDKDDERRSVYSTMICLQCFLSKTEYANLQNTIRKRMNYFDNRVKSIDINKIIVELGFPINWHVNTKKIIQ